MPPTKLTHDSYKVGWICPLEVEQIAAMEMLDEEHEPLAQPSTDHNVYSLGSINGHNVVIAGLHQTGNCSAAIVVTQMRMTFPKLKFGLLVGIGGGVPIETDVGPIRLGHVVVSEPTGQHSGTVQYDHGKALEGRFERTGALAPPPAALLSAARALAVHRARADEDPVWTNIQRIQAHRRRLRRYKLPGIAEDHLYQPHYIHQTEGRSCEEGGCDAEQRIERVTDEDDESYIVVHRGTIASGEVVLKNANIRDLLAHQHKVLCFEMEAAGVLADFPCLVIRGISDYCDSHKNDRWHGYAAAAAAAYARQLFFHLPVEAVPGAERNDQSPGTWVAKCIVPYPSNPHFVGRSKILQRLKDNLGHIQETGGTSQPRVSVFGLGGIGKTQIALAYVYWLQEMYPSIAILWVHASNAERFRQSFKAIAEEYQIPGHDDSKDILALVKAWLEKRDGRRWLMVLDNADDMQLFFPPSTGSTSSSAEPNDARSFSDYLPECAHGAILITTRNKQLGIKLAKGQCVIGVDRMDEDESEHLLRAKHIIATSPDLLSLSARLENLPLALVQAAAYIQGMTITVAKYLELLGESDQHMVHLLSEEFETVGRDTKAPRAVAQTWILSFQQIEQQRALASNLLSFMSFFDRQEIPATFLSHYTKQNTNEEAVGDLKLTEALGVLKAFSFVTEDNNGNYDMHRLVQLVTRKWLVSCGTVDQFGKEALLTVLHLYPYGEYETRTICSAYQSHANAVLQSCKFDSEDEAKAKAHLLHCMAAYLLFEGKWRDAEALGAEAVHIKRKLFGEDHPDTLSSMANLASTFSEQGRWEEAEKLKVQVLETRKITLGVDHPSTLVSMTNLARTFWEQGRWEEAEKLGVQALETRKITLGVDHPSTLRSMSNLAFMFSEQGRWEEAETLEVQVLETEKIKLGADHPDTLITMHNLACTWYDMEKESEAINLMRLCIRLRQAKLGLDHPDTRSSIAFLDYWEGKG